MDLKSDDLFNIDIDPAILLSYDLDKLNLDNIPSDIFELPEEISNNDLDSSAENTVLVAENTDLVAENKDLGAESKDLGAENKDSGAENDGDSGSENDVTPEDKQVNETADSKYSEEYSANSFAEEDKLCSVEALQENVQAKASSRKTKRKKDINGNDEPLQDEILNELFVKLELSDSDNEEVQDGESTELRERGPIRPRRKAYRIRDQISILNKTDTLDRAQFNPERLKFLSGGSNQIQSYETSAVDQIAVLDSLTASCSGSDLACVLPNQDLSYEDARAVSVCSPESGYDSSSTLSITGSPPPLPVSLPFNLDFIPETVDEQIILDFLVENTDCALTDNLSVCNIDEKDAKDKILSFLKDIPAEAQNFSDTVVSTDGSVLNHVPSSNYSGDFNTDYVLLPPVLCNSVPNSIKKIAPSKLNDTAKRTLQEFLSKDELYAVAGRIYKRVADDIANKKKCGVIYVENEDDKTSENRTNLHYAVLNSNIEDIYCLVEIHKKYGYSLRVINNRDKYGKTALDYAIENEMALVVDYLKENTAIRSVRV